MQLTSDNCAKLSNKHDILHCYRIPVLLKVNQGEGERVTNQVNTGPELGKIFQNILLFALVIFLPCLERLQLGWLTGILPLLVFVFLYRFGLHVGNRIILTGAALALTAGLVVQRFEPMLLSYSLIPSGYALAQGALRRETPFFSGLKGTVVLGACWLVLLGLYAAIHQISPYAEFVHALDQGIAEALAYYRQSDSVSSETLLVLETTLYQTKVILPLIIPGILAGFALLTIWFTMTVGNRFLYQVTGDSPWPRYRVWQLPDKLIWLLIIAALFALLPVRPLKIAGINILILSSIVYCFQGLAVFSFFLHKWNVPLLLRSFLYVMIVFQSFGTVVLLGLGITDVWLDFRKLKNPADKEPANNTTE